MTTTITCATELEWLRERQKRVTASEAAALCEPNVHPRCSPYSLYYDKQAEIAEPEAPHFDDPSEHWRAYGHLSEPVTAQMYATVTGRVLRDIGEYTILVDESEALSCTPDYVCDPAPDGFVLSEKCSLSEWHPTPADGPGIVQIKNVDAYQWFRDWAGSVPLWIQVQNQVEIACAGYSWGSIAATVGGNRLYFFDQRRNDRLIDYLRRRARWLLDCIESGDEPPTDGHDATERALKDGLGEVVEGTIMLPQESVERWTLWMQARLEIEHWTSEKRRQEAWFRRQMGDIQYAIIPDVGRINHFPNNHGPLSRALLLPKKANAEKARSLAKKAGLV